MTETYSFIRFGAVGAVGWLEFKRPPVNAFTRPMVDEVHDCIAAALADPKVRVLVLASGVEKYFSAGADLNSFKGMPATAIDDTWCNVASSRRASSMTERVPSTLAARCSDSPAVMS